MRYYSTQICEEQYGKEVTVAGWIEDIRNLGGIAFIIVRDKKGKLQITVVKKENPELFKKITNLSRESVVLVEGKCAKNEEVMNGYEVFPSKLSILSIASSPLPMGIADKVGVDFDTRLDNRFLDLRRSEVGRIFTIRDLMLDAARRFLHSNDFMEVHTPKITSSSSEGGAEVFKLKYFEKNAFLAQSPQLYKQILMATGFDRVYEIAWYFRAEEHNTLRHLNESTAIDVEMAFIRDEEDIMMILEEMTKSILMETTGEKLDLNIPKTFPRLTYDEVVEMLGMKWGEDLGTEEERSLGKIMEEDFYFIKNFPLEIKPFYAMPNKKYARAFDLDCRGMEIASGAQRIHDLELLKERMRVLSIDEKKFKDYLKAFKYGMPPHGGFGFGIERFLMKILGIKNIRECILFPRDRKRLRP